MGYQIVDITLKDGKVLEKVIVFNAEELGLPPEYKELKMEEIENIRLSKK